ncbi:coiled-coil domain-containing protein 22 homolog [Bacillus rossius redtenbacheri]|uniref:coiled-coil domain-containing protein 22 homolog n=1 Tax=Bacillus rossius redtenbacheri TaxID=93214 RepID=UPI002FDDEA60
MEDLDNIIIHSLKQVGCDIEEEVTTIGEFSTELVVEAAVRCLDIIQPGLGLEHKLPPNMSARYRLGASIAQACKVLGYRGDIGYQTFLYSSESDIRRVLMFLIEKLPKEAEKTVVPFSGKHGALEQAIADVLQAQLASAWLPGFCRDRGVRWRDDGSWSREGYGPARPFLGCSLGVPSSSSANSQAQREYNVHHLPVVTDQLPAGCHIIPSIIALNAEGRLSGGKPRPGGAAPPAARDVLAREASAVAQDLTRRLEETAPVPVPVPVPVPKPRTAQRHDGQSVGIGSKPPVAPRQGTVKSAVEKRQEELEAARQAAETLRQELSTLQADSRQLKAKLAQVQDECLAEQQAAKEQEDSCLLRSRTHDLLPDAEGNLARLQSLVDGCAQKLVGLAAQWDKRRLPLLEQYRSAKESVSKRATENQQQAAAARDLRDRLQELEEESRLKEQLHAQLRAECEQVTKNVNRSAYTRRIMEIIGNIRKQKDEIDKVLADTKELQKEINTLTGRLDRSFTVADELIFKDAKRDEVARKAYKMLASLHSDCEELVNMVEETGATVRENRDLEEQVESERAKNVAANLERISADLRQMKQESTALTAQLKTKT